MEVAWRIPHGFLERSYRNLCRSIVYGKFVRMRIYHPIHAILIDIFHTILWVGYLDPPVTPTGLASVFRRRIQAADSAFPGLLKMLVFTSFTSW